MGHDDAEAADRDLRAFLVAGLAGVGGLYLTDSIAIAAGGFVGRR